MANVIPAPIMIGENIWKKIINLKSPVSSDLTIMTVSSSGPGRAVVGWSALAAASWSPSRGNGWTSLTLYTSTLLCTRAVEKGFHNIRRRPQPGP